jgi:hypothetical protein
MSKKSFFFFILFLLVIIGGFGWFFVFRTPQNAELPAEEEIADDRLFPFGNRDSGVVRPTETKDIGTSRDEIGVPLEEKEVLPQLRQISFVPTSGGIAFDTASTTIIRYQERATGHLFETDSDSSAVRKISNVTIPKVYESLWTIDGNRLLMRYLREDNATIRTFYAKIATTTRPERALEGLFLSDNIREISLMGSKAFYLSDTANGSQGIVSNIDGSNKTSVFSSSFSDWSSMWNSANVVTLYTRPSGLDRGYAYILNPASGAYTKVAGGMTGLTALANNDGTRVFVSSGGRNNIETYVYDVKKDFVVPIALATAADKCIWSSKHSEIIYCAVPSSITNGIYPDDWYKGKVSFDDSLWKINSVTGETEEIMTPILMGQESMDMVNLDFNQTETVLTFINKKDLTLWRYRF